MVKRRTLHRSIFFGRAPCAGNDSPGAFRERGGNDGGFNIFGGGRGCRRMRHPCHGGHRGCAIGWGSWGTAEDGLVRPSITNEGAQEPRSCGNGGRRHPHTAGCGLANLISRHNRLCSCLLFLCFVPRIVLWWRTVLRKRPSVMPHSDDAPHSRSRCSRPFVSHPLLLDGMSDFYGGVFQSSAIPTPVLRARTC